MAETHQDNKPPDNDADVIIGDMDGAVEVALSHCSHTRLPNEIWDMIFAELAQDLHSVVSLPYKPSPWPEWYEMCRPEPARYRKRGSLASFATVCRGWQFALEPYIFKTLVVEVTTLRSLPKLSQAGDAGTSKISNFESISTTAWTSQNTHSQVWN